LEAAAIPDIGLPVPVAAVPDTFDHAGPTFQKGHPGWFGRLRQVAQKSDSNNHSPGSLTTLLQTHEVLGVNFPAPKAASVWLHFRWRAELPSFPREGKAAILDVSLVRDVGTQPTLGANAGLVPIWADPDSSGWTSETLALALDDTARTVTVKFGVSPGGNHARIELEDVRIETRDATVPDLPEQISSFLTTRFRGRSGTPLQVEDLPPMPYPDQANAQTQDWLQPLYKSGILTDLESLPADQMKARQKALQIFHAAVDSALMGGGKKSGWLPHGVYYLRGGDAIGSLREFFRQGRQGKQPGLANLGPDAGVVLDFRQSPKSGYRSYLPACEPTSWQHAMDLAACMTDKTVDLLVYEGDEDFWRDFDSTDAATREEDGRIILQTLPHNTWTDRPPVVVLTNLWSDALTVLALKGRPGVKVVGETTRNLKRPATQFRYTTGQIQYLPTGVYWTPDGTNILIDGVVPDVPVAFSADEDRALTKALEVLVGMH